MNSPSSNRCAAVIRPAPSFLPDGNPDGNGGTQRPVITIVGDQCGREHSALPTTRPILRGRTFTTRAEANLALFEYIDGFHNSRRIQERLGFLSPVEFEEKHYAEQATAEPTNLNTRQPLLTS